MAESLQKNIPLGIEQIFTKNTVFKRSYLFLTTFPELEDFTIQTLPPEKAARPTYDFTSRPYEHLTQTITYPLKMKNQPVDFTWYDIVQNIKNPTNVVYNWITKFYNPQTGNQGSPAKFKTRIQLGMYTSEGEIIETWIYEGAYPTNVKFGTLEMSGNQSMSISATLQYDRAYWIAGLGG
jgi:hypothetical protein